MKRWSNAGHKKNTHIHNILLLIALAKECIIASIIPTDFMLRMARNKKTVMH